VGLGLGLGHGGGGDEVGEAADHSVCLEGHGGEVMLKEVERQ